MCLPTYTHPLHTNVCNWESPAGPENQRPAERGLWFCPKARFSRFAKGRADQPRTLKVPGRLTGSVNLTPAYSER